MGAAGLLVDLGARGWGSTLLQHGVFDVDSDSGQSTAGGAGGVVVDSGCGVVDSDGGVGQVDASDLGGQQSGFAAVLYFAGRFGAGAVVLFGWLGVEFGCFEYGALMLNISNYSAHLVGVTH